MPMPTQDTQVMLSEEEEEEDEESELEIAALGKQQPGGGSKKVSKEPTNNATRPRTQIFSGSSDEWTDKRIQEF